MIVSTEAIIIHSRRFGDSSRIVTAYSRELGKVGLVAKGARTTSSSLGPALEPLSHVQLTVYHAKNRDLHTVSRAETAIARSRLHASYEHLSAGLLMCELILRTQAQEQPDGEIFELLCKALGVLDASTQQEAYAVSVAMRLRLADIMGFGIQRAPLPNELSHVTIDVTDGTVNAHSNGIRLSIAAYALMHNSLRGRWMTSQQADRLEIESFLSVYFSHHLDTRITPQAFNTLL
ncbi:MAG TPA: DNA repair protein RecO [Bacteroidetes bacterium]|nr:DNA repair protein RecO [Bacteroidota bacterium]